MKGMTSLSSCPYYIIPGGPPHAITSKACSHAPQIAEGVSLDIVDTHLHSASSALADPSRNSSLQRCQLRFARYADYESMSWYNLCVYRDVGETVMSLALLADDVNV